MRLHGALRRPATVKSFLMVPITTIRKLFAARVPARRPLNGKLVAGYARISWRRNAT